MAAVVYLGNERKSGAGFIAATWICTKSFWFLRPGDELLSFRSL